MGIRRYIVASCLTLLCYSPVWANPPVPGAVEHRVTDTDTLGILSRKYGVSPEKLRAINGGKPPAVGQTFWVPPWENWPRHKVVSGQTLAEIAQGFHISEAQLRQANLLKAGETPGETLIIPRAKKPEWKEIPKSLASRSGNVPRVEATNSSRNVIRSPRVTAKPAPKPVEPSQPKSRSTGSWVKVNLTDGRVGWVRSGALKFEEKGVPESRSGSLPFGKRLSDSQKISVYKMVDDLADRGYRVKAEDIINFMALETGGTFDPAARSQWNGAVGLAQFTDIAIQDLNASRPADDKLSKSRLAEMSFEEQSKVVTDYLSKAFERKQMQGKEIHSSDLYSAIFCPKAIGLPLTSTIYSSGRDPGAYQRNRSLDKDKDGRITKQEMVVRLNEWAERGEAQRG